MLGVVFNLKNLQTEYHNTEKYLVSVILVEFSFSMKCIKMFQYQCIFKSGLMDKKSYCIIVNDAIL
jgi:hypothetical protein